MSEKIDRAQFKIAIFNKNASIDCDSYAMTYNPRRK